MRLVNSTQWPARRATALDLFEEMDRMFSDLHRGTDREYEKSFVPACDVTEADEHYLMTMDLPGFKKEDIKIEMNENILTVSGERKREAAENRKGHRIERSYGTFTRSFSLPTTVSPEKIEAQYEDGVLNLYLPKTPVAKARTIQIQSKTGGFFERILGKKEADEKTTTTINPH